MTARHRKKGSHFVRKHSRSASLFHRRKHQRMVEEGRGRFDIIYFSLGRISIVSEILLPLALHPATESRSPTCAAAVMTWIHKGTKLVSNEIRFSAKRRGKRRAEKRRDEPPETNPLPFSLSLSIPFPPSSTPRYVTPSPRDSSETGIRADQR